MRAAARPGYVVAVLSVVASFANPGSPARAAGATATGFLCSVSGSPVLGTEDVDLVTVGPATVTEADGVTPASGTLYCRVVVTSGAWVDHTSPGTDVAGRGTGVLTGRPAVLRLPAADGRTQVDLCTRFDNESDGVTYYWDDLDGVWSTSASTPCGLAYVDDADAPLDPLIDSIVCPIFATAFPPEGDIAWVWDCPPYGDEGSPPFITPAACTDGIDNDGDGLADYPADPGCASAADRDEHSYAACDDGADNDGDRYADYPQDPGCASATDTDERGTTECDDGIDNDGDHVRDYVLDRGCTSPADPSESDRS